MEGKWSDLPFDLTSIISNQLGLIDLLSFRAVCSHWRSSASEASAEIESSVPVPWFLLNGETALCSILTCENTIYQIEIPEIVESTCLASFVGWLLLYRKKSNSLCFFCPFSRAKIEIPQCPLISQHSGSYLYGAFSSYPTDPDCTVIVVAKNNNRRKPRIRLFMLHRGESEWTFHEHKPFKGKIKSVSHYKRAFYFSDESKTRLVGFEYDTMTWSDYNFVAGDQDHGTTVITFDYQFDWDWIDWEPFSSKCDEMKQLLGIDNQDRCSISICGAMVLQGDANHHVRPHEFVKENGGESNKPRRELKGVWLQPRFHQISEDQQRW